MGTLGITTTDLLLILFSIHAGLYAARNVPISAIMMSLSMGRCWPVFSLPEPVSVPIRAGLALRLNPCAMSPTAWQPQRNTLVIVVLAASAAIAMNGGRVLSAQVASAHFDEKVFPVKATEFIAGMGIHDHLFNSDVWSGYLIYKLYPRTKLYFDDRHDFYGEAFIKEYKKAATGTWQWREPLEKYQVKWVLIATDSPLSSVLKESKDWRVEYDDGLAIVFARIN